MTEDDVRAVLRELRNDPVPADSLARVRLAVEERTQAQTWRRWLRGDWKPFGVLTAAAVLALLAVVFRPAPKVVPLAPARTPVDVTSNPASPPPPAVVPKPPKAPAAVRAKSNRARPRKAAPNGSMVVRIETADPDVVILLIGS